MCVIKMLRKMVISLSHGLQLEEKNKVLLILSLNKSTSMGVNFKSGQINLPLSSFYNATTLITTFICFPDCHMKTGANNVPFKKICILNFYCILF